MFINNHERVQDECSKKIETLERKPIEKNENFGIVIKQQTDYFEKNIKNQKNTNFYEEHFYCQRTERKIIPFQYLLGIVQK